MIDWIFYVFAFLLILGSLMVILAKDVIQSVLSLIFCCLNAAALLIMTGAEFIAMILIIVYVGAVMVLFLFVVMTIDVTLKSKNIPSQYILLLSAFIGTIMFSLSFFENNFFTNLHTVFEKTNIEEIAQVLYTKKFLQLQICGIILLLGLMGAILLFTTKHDGKKQNAWKQITASNRIKIIHKTSGDGI